VRHGAGAATTVASLHVVAVLPNSFTLTAHGRAQCPVQPPALNFRDIMPALMHALFPSEPLCTPVLLP
jgi:hypothetical protein